MNNENSLYHFGVKGMRWGRRKASAKTGGASSKKNSNFKRELKYGGRHVRILAKGVIAQMGYKLLNDAATASLIGAGKPVLANIVNKGIKVGAGLSGVNTIGTLIKNEQERLGV